MTRTVAIARARAIFSDLFGHAEAYPIRGVFFFTYVGFLIVGNFLPVAMRREGFSGKQIGYIGTQSPVMMFVVQPLWGVLADRFGRRRCLWFATLAAGTFYLRLYSVRGFWPLFLTAAGMTFFSTPLGPLLDTIALDFVETNGKLSYSMFRIWGAIAAAVGTGGAGYVIEGQSVHAAFLWAAGAMVVALVLGAIAKPAVPLKAVEKVAHQGLRPVLRKRPFLVFLVIVFFAGLFSTSFWNFYGVYFTDIGGSSALFGVAIAVSAAGEIPLYLLAGPIIRRFGIERALVFTFVCSTLRLFAYAFVGNPRVAIWIELSNGVSWTLFWIAAVEYVNQIVTSEWRATGQSLLNASCWGVAIILGMLGDGFLLDYFKSHVINPWVPLAIQKVCFLSGILFAGLTLASIIYFSTASKQARVMEEVISVPKKAA